jgi:hypothetical protein
MTVFTITPATSIFTNANGPPRFHRRQCGHRALIVNAGAHLIAWEQLSGAVLAGIGAPKQKHAGYL